MVRLTRSRPLARPLVRPLAFVIALLTATVTIVGSAAPARAATTWLVGPTRTLTTPSAAAAVARDGDTVLIDAADYHGDVATWNQDDLTLAGVGGRARLHAAGKSAQGKAIWVIAGDRVTVDSIEFRDAVVPDRNGAGIRGEGTGLTIRNSRFINNEDGILTGANPNSDILIETSEFAGSGVGDGFSHNIYIGAVRSFTLRGSWSHNARVGHNVKSRALRTVVEYSRIDDEDGTASYSIDLSDGGEAIVRGNVIRQGPNSPNSALVTYAPESQNNPGRTLDVVNNTFVNDRVAGAVFVNVAGSGVTTRFVNNLVVGNGTLLAGSGASGALDQATVRATGGVVDRAGLDMRLVAGSPAIDAGVDPGAFTRPVLEYRHATQLVARQSVGAFDVGAHEYAAATSTSAPVGFAPLAPTRIVDTRVGLAGARLQANVASHFAIVGRGGVPAGASGVHLNVTGVGQSGDGFVSIFPCGPPPPVSNLNLAGSKPSPSAVSVGLDTDGAVCALASVDTDLVIDLSGWFGASAPNRYRAIDNPIRAVDSREPGLVRRLPANSEISLTVTAPGATAVNLNVAAVDPGGDGYLTVYPCANGRPLTSNLNPATGVNRANLVVVPVDAQNKVCVYTYAETDVVIDMAGTWTTAGGSYFQAITPVRHVDTRTSTGASRLGRDATTVVSLAASAPAGATGVHVNATAVFASGAGYLTVWPCDQPRPLTSNVNFGDARPVPNAAAVRLSPTKTICLSSNVGTDAIIDVFGWYVG